MQKTLLTTRRGSPVGDRPPDADSTGTDTHLLRNIGDTILTSSIWLYRQLYWVCYVVNYDDVCRLNNVELPPSQAVGQLIKGMKAVLIGKYSYCNPSDLQMLAPMIGHMVLYVPDIFASCLANSKLAVPILSLEFLKLFLCVRCVTDM